MGFRRTQFRAERYLTFSESCQGILQVSVNQDIVVDFPVNTGVRREASDWPVVEARTAFRWQRRDGAAVVLGVSGHIGETGFDFVAPGPPPLNLPPADDRRFTTWSLNTDLQLPITNRLEVRGEFFAGENLSPYFGGIGQGVCPCLRIPIRSNGGWGEIRYDWSDRLSSHVGYGVDDPNNDDSLFGRVYNQMLFANVILNVTPQLATGLEVGARKTLYQERRRGLIPTDQLTSSEPGEAITIDWMVKYAF